MQDGNKWSECSVLNDKTGDRLDCLATFCWLKKTIRIACQTMEEHRYQIVQLWWLKKQFEVASHPFNHQPDQYS